LNPTKIVKWATRTRKGNTKRRAGLFCRAC